MNGLFFKKKEKKKKNSTFKSPALNSVLSRRFGCAPKIQKDKPALRWLVVQVSDHTSQKWTCPQVAGAKGKRKTFDRERPNKSVEQRA
jgi:hypothetical protein